MKLKLYVWCHLPNVYPRFQVHILKYAEIKLRKHSAGKQPCWAPPFECLGPPEDKILSDHDENQYGSKHLLYKCMYKIWKFYIIIDVINEERWLTYLFLAVKYIKLSWLWWNSNSMCATAYSMYIPDFKLIYQNIYKHLGKLFAGGSPAELPRGLKMAKHDENR